MSGSVYPGAIDNFVDPTPANSLSDGTVLHSTQHANLNDAVTAIETVLGTNPSGSFASVAAGLTAATDGSAIDAHLGTVANVYYAASYPGDTMSAKITAALFAATSAGTFDQNVTVVLPTGKFTVPPNVFSSWGQSGVKRGLIIKGGGTYATQLTLTTGGASSWFYDNGATDVAQFVRFEDMSFFTDDTTGQFGNFMRLTGRGNEQHFIFKSCWWGPGFTRVFDFEGNAGDDSVRTYDCRVTSSADCFLYINNPQSVLNEHYGLNAETLSGDLVHVGPNGGGDVKFFGGSIILIASNTANKQTWIVNVDNSLAGSGPGNSWFGFYGVRTELRAQTNGYVYAIGSGSLTKVSFIGGNYYVAGSTTPHDMIHIGLSKTVSFSDARLSTSSQIAFEVANASASGATDPVVMFTRCELPNDLATQVSYVNGTAYGRVIADGCHLLSVTPGNPKVAMDFDYNASNALAGGPTSKKKVAMLKSGQALWPNSNGNESTITLPPGAFVQRIYASKPAYGGSSATYQLAVSNGDKSVVYGTGTSGQMRYAQTVDASPGIFCGTDVTSRTVRLYAPTAGDATAISGGMAYVEYI